MNSKQVEAGIELLEWLLKKEGRKRKKWAIRFLIYSKESDLPRKRANRSAVFEKQGHNRASIAE